MAALVTFPSSYPSDLDSSSFVTFSFRYCLDLLKSTNNLAIISQSDD